MDKIELYRPHISKAASTYAYSTAMTNYAAQLYTIQCPGYDLGIRHLAQSLVDSKVISPENMLDFLKKNSNYNSDSECWWK